MFEYLFLYFLLLFFCFYLSNFLLLSFAIINCCLLYPCAVINFSTNSASRQREKNNKNSLNGRESHFMSLMYAIIHWSCSLGLLHHLSLFVGSTPRASTSSCTHISRVECVLICYYFVDWCLLANRSTSCGLAHLHVKAACAPARLAAQPFIKCNLYAHFVAALLCCFGMANRKLDYLNCNLVKVLVVSKRVGFALLSDRYKYSDFIRFWLQAG